MKKSKSLLRNISSRQLNRLRKAGEKALFFTEDAASTSAIKEESVQLTVTSPPFLNIVDYAADNWLRAWFNGYKADNIDKKLTVTGSMETWCEVMKKVFCRLHHLTAHGGWVAFEVGEVRKGKVKLEQYVPALGEAAGFQCAAVLINQQNFTKTSNIWGVSNNLAGTNSNRIVLFYKP